MRRLQIGRRAVILGSFVGALIAVVGLAPSASAVVVKVKPGQRAGVLPVRGINPASFPGRVRASNRAEPAGTLDYHGGIVMHGASAYLVFWDPSHAISAADKALYARYLADSAADSGKDTNVYSVGQQFTDSTGFARYHQVWNSSHSITDTQAYPTSDCANNSTFTETNCVTDAQIQAELTRLIAAQHLPTGEGGDAPEYFVVTPPKVNSCFDNSTTNPICADNYFCAYHSSYADGGSTPNVIYSDMPTVLAANDPKGCQYDQSAYDHPPGIVQAPNGSATKVADVTLKALSHEFNESITDPNGDAWWASASGQENGDECNFYNPTSDPANDGNPNAFTPTLGGSESAGTLYNQLINGNKYYIQSEWSNGGLDCEMRPTSKALTATFTAPSTAAKGFAVSFDPTGSSAAAGYSSATWSWGDGTADSFHNLLTGGTLGSQSHTFAATGTFTVTLTLVDKFGNLTSVSHVVTVKLTTPSAAFSSSPNNPTAGSTVAFDGSASTDTGGTLTSYSWDFGDGSMGTGETTSHAYSQAGTYSVTLTVGDGTDTDTVTHTVTVTSVPKAAFGSSPASPAAGSAASFDASASTDTGGTLSSYSWDFGDGSSGTGQTTTHSYSAPGTYTVKLTVGDGTGATDSISHTVTVHGALTPLFSVSTSTSPVGQAIAFNGSGSSEANGSIASYAWSFGDGATGTGATTSHAYATAGTYTVTLTVTDATGGTASSAQQVKISGVPKAEMAIISGHAIAGVSFAFDGHQSTDAGSTITSYSWNFGDGGTATGVAPKHAYKKTGKFSVTLTVTDASGSTASVTEPVVVKAPSIANVRVKKGAKVERLKVKLSGPGTLRLGSKKVKVGRPRTITLKVKLTKSQLKTLANKHKLTARYKLRFTPVTGAKSTKKVTIKLTSK